MKELVGTGVALITPFNEDGSLDFIGLEKLVEHMIQGKVDYLVVLGTTGETATLTFQEKQEVLAHVKKINANRLPIVLGIGGNNTAAVTQEFSQYNLKGVSAILSASPYYNKPTQEGIYQHYKALSENSPLPIILYNVPGRTASNISAGTTLRLAKDFENIIGIKEASADLNQVMAIIKDRPKDFLVISGEDGITFPMIACGGEGVISVVGNAYPKEFSDMVRYTLDGELDKAKDIHYSLLDFTDNIFAEGNPGGIKAAMKLLGICGDFMRLPLYKISKELENKIKESMI